MPEEPNGPGADPREPGEVHAGVEHKGHHIRRVGIVFSGGPAPAANAVIAAAAISLLDDGREVIGFFDGYTHLQEYHPITHRLQAERHYRILTDRDVLGIRNRRGILIGTARANPGSAIEREEDLGDPQKNTRLAAVYNALVDLEIDALISIGGDDTLKTANYLYLFQCRLPEEARRVRIVHLPKTIDNDYWGIDFTFGFFTSVDVMAKELLNLRADAQSSGSWFVVETMGRKAGWLSYGTAIAGEANLVLATEDVEGSLCGEEEVHDPVTGTTRVVRCLDLGLLVDRIVDLMLQREQQVHKAYGVVVLAEGVAEMLPPSLLKDVPRDPHGHISLGKLDLGRMVSEAVKRRYRERTGREKKVTSVQLGYESRCAPPHAFDVMLGSQLGIGAYRALVEEGLDGHMVSVSGQLELHYVPFSELVDPHNLRTRVRYITPGSDFHRLARFLETRAAAAPHWKVDGSQR